MRIDDSVLNLTKWATTFAECVFRRIKGYKQIPILQNALARLTESGDCATLESA
jgi:hypothetical protein